MTEIPNLFLFVVLARDSSCGRNSFDKTHFLKEMDMAWPIQDQMVQKLAPGGDLHTNIDVQKKMQRRCDNRAQMGKARLAHSHSF
jgi:hypothetical protein